MDNLDLRQAIKQRVHNKPGNELTEVIEDSIDSDERALPGLGVLFELIWQGSDAAARQSMVATLHQQLSGAGAR
ncbi:small acid-soluble spore protein SspI [Paenibacillus sp. IB182496]|uniref:Small, acid-soluble spore protein I n=1 Tax=Paenibacillus sabuli TaxID=2772509 RepID=A0A927GR29_9BACL|nr:small acid-soluble spore protein SspI [Paenibacillus sabuli]MBD2844367.1 small acid-soluble spore protein SspI [Paenibacillus sabuli]